MEKTQVRTFLQLLLQFTQWADSSTRRKEIYLRPRLFSPLRRRPSRRRHLFRFKLPRRRRNGCSSSLLWRQRQRIASLLLGGTIPNLRHRNHSTLVAHKTVISSSRIGMSRCGSRWSSACIGFALEDLIGRKNVSVGAVGDFTGTVRWSRRGSSWKRRNGCDA